MCFKFFGKEYVNMVLGGYFFLLGSASLTSMLRPVGELVSPKWFTDEPWELSMTRSVVPTAADDASEDDKKKAAAAAKAGEKEPEVWLAFKFDMVDLVCLGMAAVIGVWYLTTKSWIATNFYGLSFSINGISMFALPSFPIGAVLLCGLFFYDVFWVFGTDVMVTVARSFDAPIKVLFPKDFIENGIWASELAMLGLGDIVLPGIVIALLLRFDVHHNRTGKPYFWATYIAYLLGLLFTIVVMHTFKAAQPALLYLVPAVLLTPITLALVRGELKQLFAYDEEALLEEDKKEDKKSK
jgi:minor histocompatibility antigen H13